MQLSANCHECLTCRQTQSNPVKPSQTRSNKKPTWTRGAGLCEATGVGLWIVGACAVQCRAGQCVQQAAIRAGNLHPAQYPSPPATFGHLTGPSRRAGFSPLTYRAGQDFAVHKAKALGYTTVRLCHTLAYSFSGGAIVTGRAVAAWRQQIHTGDGLWCAGTHAHARGWGRAGERGFSCACDGSTKRA